MIKVAPSLLSANFACLKDDIEKIENKGVFKINYYFSLKHIKFINIVKNKAVKKLILKR